MVTDVVPVLAVDLPRHPLRLPSSNLQDELRLSWRGWKYRQHEWHRHHLMHRLGDIAPCRWTDPAFACIPINGNGNGITFGD